MEYSTESTEKSTEGLQYTVLRLCSCPDILLPVNKTFQVEEHEYHNVFVAPEREEYYLDRVEVFAGRRGIFFCRLRFRISIGVDEESHGSLRSNNRVI